MAKADDNQTLIVRTFLLILLLLVTANIVFQWYAKPFDLNSWISLIGPALTTVLYAYYRRKPVAEIQRKHTVLMVEDQEAYAVRLRLGFDRRNYGANLMRVESCEEAMKVLRSESPYEFVDLPDVLLLDLSYPQMQLQGIDMLAQMRASQKTCEVPVVILSSVPDRHLIADATPQQRETLSSACAIVEKGQGIDAVIEAIERCLTSHEASPKLIVHDDEVVDSPITLESHINSD